MSTQREEPFSFTIFFGGGVSIHSPNDAYGEFSRGQAQRIRTHNPFWFSPETLGHKAGHRMEDHQEHDNLWRCVKKDPNRMLK